ncbi:MAG: Hsp20/alpha crystallin family protein [Candidatus Falkowbacteria bacterium]
MSFLDKLKRKVDVLEEGKQAAITEEKPAGDANRSNYAQLDVDIYETPSKFIIISATSGVDINNLDISIGEENDVLIIQGKKVSPIDQVKLSEKQLVHHHQECQWGDFYRQIILPQEINPDMVEAYEEKGVLVIILPLLRLQKGKRSIQVSMRS